MSRESAAKAAYERAKKKYPLGEGHRFKAMSNLVQARGAKTPGALAAYIGRRSLGKERFQRLAARGRARAAYERNRSRK